MTDLSSIDILVVGAGPVGLTLAIDLARRGINCRIIDKLATFPVGTRARGIGARTQEIFEDLGVLDALSAYAEPFLPSRIYNGKNQFVREVNPASSIDPAMLPKICYCQLVLSCIYEGRGLKPIPVEWLLLLLARPEAYQKQPFHLRKESKRLTTHPWFVIYLQHPFAAD